ncbi:MAG: RHS repeat protein, partial [Actinomycetia bacterium]|nr:RHS repeat protein [Actinomycetes bacterium]
SQVLSYYPGYPVPPAVCDADVAFVDWTPLDLGVLLDADNPHPLAIPTLIHRYGLGIMEATSLNAPDDLRALSDRCAAIDNTALMGGMAVVQAYPMDLDGDGTVSAGELRDYVVVTNARVENDNQETGWVMVFDVTNRAQPLLVGQIELPSPVSTIVADRHNRRLYVAALGFGLHVVDFDRAPSLLAIDTDGDGIDDRVIESIAIDQESVTHLALAPELGLIFAGGQNVGVNSIVVAPPRLTVVAADGGSRSVARVAPFGVPTAAVGLGGELPGRVRIEARLPGGLANAAGELRLDLVSEGPGGLEIDGAGDPDLIAGLPPTSYRGNDGLLLRRLSDRPYDEGYGIFVSEPIVLIADLRASAYYQQTPEEENVCQRCDLVAEGVYSALELSAGTGLSRELLSGHRLAVRFPPAFRILTGKLYGTVALDQAEIEVASVPWDIGPAVRQEPRLNPSYGSGDVVPGTLLHSGEMSMAATDLHLRGRGLDFAFVRTYRSQIVGGGPLGPGWDHGYRMRLRELPNGDVEYFDGRGRRELFKLARQATGVYDLPVGSFQQLNRHESGWNIVDPSDTLLRFDRYGRLVSISDSIKTAPEVGTALEFSYDLRSRLVEVDAHGRWIKLGYDDAGRLINLSDFSGREFHYGYDADGRLMEMETPAVATFEAPDVSANAPLVTRYAYQAADLDPCAHAQRCLAERLNRRNNLETVTDPKGQTWLELTYEDKAGDSREEEVSAQKWGVDTVQIDYSNRHLTRREVTDRRGLKWNYDHNDRGQPLFAKDPQTTGPFWEYNEQGSVTRIQLPSGRKLHYTLDSNHWDKRLRGNVLLVREESSDGSEPPEESPTTEVRYGAANRPEWIKDPKGNLTEIVLLDTGLASKVSKDGVEIRREFNDFGQVTLVANGNGNDTKYEYFEENPKKGLLKQIVVDPEDPALTTDLALTTTYEYDARGNRVEVTSPRGVRHQFVYNALDWLIEEKWAVLTSNGDLEPIGHRVRYSHDRNGNVTQVERQFGESHATWTRTQADYGLLDEVLETRQEVTPGIADWVIERFGYDENLNLIKLEGPDGQLTRYAYDERNHLSTRIREIGPGDPGNLLESFVFNAVGQPELRTDARGEVWQIAYDGYDRPREWTNPLGHKTEVGYDKNSNPVWVKVFEADGRLLSKREQSYDPLQRPEIETRWLWQYQALEPGEEPAAEPPSDAVAVKQKIVYDSASNAIEVWDPLNRITHFDYDSAERLIRIEDPAGNVTDLDLDAAGNAWRQVYTEQTPSGAETVRVTAFFDGLNRQASVSDQLDNTTKYYYDLRGNLIRVVDAEGKFTSYAYDGLDRRTRATRPEGIEVAYAYDASSRLVEYRDALDNVTTWSYDVFDRQSSVAYADGITESY